jgi:hypothetical protein
LGSEQVLRINLDHAVYYHEGKASFALFDPYLKQQLAVVNKSAKNTGASVQ